jgi:hypothetical protein
MMWISELCPSPVVGPISRQRLGNPATVVPRRARMSSPQVWASVTPHDADVTKSNCYLTLHKGVPQPRPGPCCRPQPGPRPTPVSELMTAEDVADSVAWAVTRPRHVHVDLLVLRLLVLRPRAQAANHQLFRE